MSKFADVQLPEEGGGEKSDVDPMDGSFLFLSEVNSDNEYDDDLLIEQIEEYSIKLKVAEEEWNAEKKTLFATYIWHGARALAEHLLLQHRDIVKGSSVLEFGAAAGLPSIVCHLLGASVVCASDYPTEHILHVLRDNIARNKVPAGGELFAVGYLWGSDEADVLAANRGHKYDFILASECLWRHEQHYSLIDSMRRVLHPSGTAIFVFSNHIPGMLDHDLSFFDKAKEGGFSVHRQSIVKKPSMFSSSGELVDMYIIEVKFADACAI